MLGIIGINLFSSKADYDQFPRFSADVRWQFDPNWALRDAFTSNASVVVQLLCASFGALILVSEFSTGQIRTTFTAVPARRSVVMAKVTVLLAVFTAFGVIVAGISFWGSQAILAGRGVGLSISYPGVFRVVASNALLAPVSAMAGFAVAAIVRHTATTIVTSTLLLLIVPLLITEKYSWSAAIHNAFPTTAWNRLSYLDSDIVTIGNHPPSIAAAWIVFAAWTVGSAVVAVILVQRRDC